MSALAISLARCGLSEHCDRPFERLDSVKQVNGNAGVVPDSGDLAADDLEVRLDGGGLGRSEHPWMLSDWVLDGVRALVGKRLDDRSQQLHQLLVLGAMNSFLAVLAPRERLLEVIDHCRELVPTGHGRAPFLAHMGVEECAPVVPDEGGRTWGSEVCIDVLAAPLQQQTNVGRKIGFDVPTVFLSKQEVARFAAREPRRRRSERRKRAGNRVIFERSHGRTLLSDFALAHPGFGASQ